MKEDGLTVGAAFHRLWTAAAIAPGYDKASWKALSWWLDAGERLTLRADSPDGASMLASARALLTVQGGDPGADLGPTEPDPG